MYSWYLMSASQGKDVCWCHTLSVLVLKAWVRNDLARFWLVFYFVFVACGLHDLRHELKSLEPRIYHGKPCLFTQRLTDNLWLGDAALCKGKGMSFHRNWLNTRPVVQAPWDSRILRQSEMSRKIKRWGTLFGPPKPLCKAIEGLEEYFNMWWRERRKNKQRNSEILSFLRKQDL